MFSKGSSTSISFAMVTPSLHTDGGPNFFSRITFLPRGPRVTFTAFARVSIPVFSVFRASSLNVSCLAMYPSSILGSYGQLVPRDIWWL